MPEQLILTTPTVAAVAAALKSRGETIVVAESSTAGLISASLLAVAGASAYYKGGSVVYTLASRKSLLGIRKADVEGLEPMTEGMAMRFAEVARTQLDATWGIAELGVAGPTGAPYGHPPGSSVIAVDGPVRMSITVATNDANRETNMHAFTAQAMTLLSSALTQA